MDIVKSLFIRTKRAYNAFLARETDPYSTPSYSQEGEDLVLKRIFPSKLDGFYVDVGAHHPRRFSNTYLFYMRGWRGINIDATPGSMSEFKKERPRDVNIECAISDKEEQIDFYLFEEKALNTFSKDLSDSYVAGGYKLQARQQLTTRRLDSILEQFVNQQIDFMSIDVEGFEMQVLLSNDWTKYRPKVLVLEYLRSDISSQLINSKLVTFLVEKKYCLIGKTANTLFFKDISFDLG
jgi:FkbM family methyltransferase